MNSCGKCALEPVTTNWDVNNLQKGLDVLNSPLLVDISTALNGLDYTVSKTTTGIVASTAVYCPDVSIPSGYNYQQSIEGLMYEMSHLLNNSAKDDLLNSLIDQSVSRADYLDKMFEFEAEGYIIREQINKQLINNNDGTNCDKTGLNSPSDGRVGDYSSLSLNNLRNIIRSNGELQKVAGIIRNGTSRQSDFEGYYTRITDQINVWVSMGATSEMMLGFIKGRCKN